MRIHHAQNQPNLFAAVPAENRNAERSRSATLEVA
jgi:hypothetical protein